RPGRPDRRRPPPPRPRPDRDEVPEDRDRPLRADRPPGGDRGGEGLRRARAPHRTRRRHRRPHRHRQDARGEQPEGRREDRDQHRPPDREPGGPQAEGGRDRRDRGEGARMRVSRSRNTWSRYGPETGPTAAVAEIIEEVRRGGDAAVLSLTERFDHAQLGPEQLRVDLNELEASVGLLEPDVLNGLRTAIANVRAVATAQVRDEPVTIQLPEGHTVDVVERPVRRAAVYVPGGRAPYPSTVVMGTVTARAAGVEEIAVCAPPGPRAGAHPVILAACVLCEVTEVYRMGGAQAIAALAFGT